MYKQKIMMKYVYAFIVILVITIGGYSLLNRIIDTAGLEESSEADFSHDDANNIAENLNSNEADTNGTDGYTADSHGDIEQYGKNFFVHILNNIIPNIKIGYEKHYNAEMPGLISTTIKDIANRANVDVTNPLTYFRFVFTAFSQYNNSKETATLEADSNGLPDITNFEDAPEGAIYFSEHEEHWTEDEENKIAYSADAAEINVGSPDNIAIHKKDPLVLIYHSHTSESYMPEIIGNFHSIDERYNVLSVGNIITNILEKKYNYNVIHDKTYHDTESYAYSYNNSLATLKEHLNRQSSLKVLLDIHRDGFAVDTADNLISQIKKDYTAKIDGKDAARVMLVVGGANENSKELEKFAVYIKKKMDTLYPGLFLKSATRNGKYYNQYFSNHSMLIEVGCSYNTIEEANYTAELVGNVLGEVLKDLEE